MMERNERSMNTRTNVRSRLKITRKLGNCGVRSPRFPRPLPRSRPVFVAERLFLTVLFVRPDLLSVEFSPFYGIEKGLVLQETRVFNEAQVRISGLVHWLIDYPRIGPLARCLPESRGLGSSSSAHSPLALLRSPTGGSSQVSASHHQAALSAHARGDLHESRIVRRILQRDQALHAQGFPPPSHGVPLH